MIAETRSIDPAAVTILNVDDNEAARYAKTRILRGAGYRVLEAGNGGDAWRLARESKPELVLLDVRLPDLDGLEVCRRIKADPSTSSMMVLLDSAVRVKREDKMAGLDGGADGYLVEPVEPGELLATVQALVRLRESEQRLHLALQATRDAVWEWDIESNTQTWSQAGTDLFGWTDVHRQHNAVAWWLDRVHPEDRQRISDTFNAVLFDPAASYWEGEYRFQKADGDYASVLDRCSIVRDEQGTALRMLGTLRDVTDLKKIEEELLARTFQWKQLYELANAVNRAGALSDLFEKALDAILLSLRADRASILLFDEGGTMRFAAWRGLSEAYRSAVEGHSPWNMDATDAAPIVIDDVTASTI
ncbi:MAG TPA: response regulator, partial [Nitrospira sp.]|nr:response regulator [Nitrospira sp.]